MQKGGLLSRSMAPTARVMTSAGPGLALKALCFVQARLVVVDDAAGTKPKPISSLRLEGKCGRVSMPLFLGHWMGDGPRRPPWAGHYSTRMKKHGCSTGLGSDVRTRSQASASCQVAVTPFRPIPVAFAVSPASSSVAAVCFVLRRPAKDATPPAPEDRRALEGGRRQGAKGG